MVLRNTGGGRQLLLHTVSHDMSLLERLRDANIRGASGIQQASWRAKKVELEDRRQTHREGMRERAQKSSRRQGAAVQFYGGR